MGIHRTNQEWIELIIEAEAGCTSQKDFCKANNISYLTFKSKKCRMKKRGICIPAPQTITLKKENEFCFSYPAAKQTLYFFPGIAPSTSQTYLSCAAVNLMKQNLFSRDWFIFLGNGKRNIYALHWYGNGFEKRQFTSQTRPFHWLDAEGNMRESTLREIVDFFE